MKSRLMASVAAIALLAGSAPLIAGQLPFKAPTTLQAQQSSELLNRAARALYDWSARTGNITDLWLFPTLDADTVFAEYRLRTSEQDAPTEHLVELTLQGDRILSLRDLTEARQSPLAY
jgi:hypothetical protein